MLISLLCTVRGSAEVDAMDLALKVVTIYK